ncbi:MAG TPA: hypothetical protein VD766_03385, partial [Solirubrobacterales bacterium]|nr:hypothetical protein [Solirubrobacterales bacterium]
AVQEAASQMGPAPKPSRAAGKSLLAAREESISQLESYITERDGEPTDEPAESVQAESPTEALARQLEASIEASLAAIGDLSSPAYRQAVHRYITEDAAALAAMRSVLGEEIVPDAFVMGPAATQEDGG